MKTNIINILLGCLIIIFSACSDNVEDATKKHVYGENESPYLKPNTDATVTVDFEFPAGSAQTQTIRLANYLEKFLKNLGLTVEQAVSGLNDGSVVFYNINPSRGNWNKAPADSNNGWNYTAAGTIATSADAAGRLELNKETNALVLSINENAPAGTVLAINVGFALNGPDYDTYVRFSIKVTLVDPTIVLVSGNMPAGDYNTFTIKLKNYAETISNCMGMTVEELLANIDDNGGNIGMYVVDTSSGEWDTTSSYTANAPGYWMDAKGAVTTWGTAGYSVFAELDVSSGDLNIGRAPGVSAGTRFTVSIGFRDKDDESKFFRFIITATAD